MSKNKIWSFHLDVGCPNDDRYPGLSKNETFDAPDDQEAKAKTLRLAQRFVKRLRPRRGLVVFVLSAPYIRYDPQSEKNILNGERMIRNRNKYANRRILQVKNPDVALVQGYGPAALDELARSYVPQTP